MGRSNYHLRDYREILSVMTGQDVLLRGKDASLSALAKWMNVRSCGICRILQKSNQSSASGISIPVVSEISASTAGAVSIEVEMTHGRRGLDDSALAGASI